MSSPGERPVPARIGKYDIVGVLGQGGMGVVYRGRDARIGRDVAIKTLTEGFSGESEMLKRFYKEAGHTGNLRHPNIVTVYDFGDEAGLPYIVMEFLDGEPLDRLIQDRDSVHLRTKLDIMSQVCGALAYAHRQGMIHRDVKPANVIVQRDGLVKLLDFGIARSEGRQTIDQSMTRTGTLVGTPAYIAPERLRGDLFDGRSDIFAAGVVLYQFLTGVLPFDAEYPAILHQILNDDPPPLGRHLSSYPPQLELIIARSLAKDPMDRYPLADEMAADLSALGMQLKSQHIEELLTESRAAMEVRDFAQAQRALALVLRIDSQHSEAKELIAQVDRYFSQVKVRQRVEQLAESAKDALEARNWDQARSACTEALQLDASNAEVTALLARASAGKQTREKIQKLLREAETARHDGRFESARDLAEKALQLDPDDARIVAICKVLEQEAQEERRKAQLRKVLEQARDNLSAARLADAVKALAEAESLGSSDPELLRLRDDLSVAIRQEERKGIVTRLEDKAVLAITLEQLREVGQEVNAALMQLPSEPTLLRIKMELEPRLREHGNRRLVGDVIAASSRLAPAEALARVQEALIRLPGNTSLLQLEAGISERLAREQREVTLAGYMAKARELLEDHLYLETVKVLEQCEQEGLSTSEIADLMKLARSAAAERISQDLVERAFLEAKQSLQEQNYEEVLRVLPPVLERVDEPSLRRLLDEAAQKQHAIEQRVELVVTEAQRLCDLEIYDAAVGLIRGESTGVRQARRVKAVLESSVAMLEGESARLESIGAVYSRMQGPDCAIALRKLSDGESHRATGLLAVEQRLRSRIGQLAEEQVAKSAKAAREALASDDPGLAETVLQEAEAWLPTASEAAQVEFKSVQAEIAAARKVLRFRRSARR